MNIGLLDIKEAGLTAAQLRDLAAEIWEQPLEEQRAVESALRYLRGVSSSRGPFCIITANGEPVGFFGVFWHTEISDSVTLRWSGVAVRARQQGYYRTALALQVEMLAKLRPNTRYIEELIPPSRSRELALIFERLGFEYRGWIADPSDLHFDLGIRMSLPINGGAPRFYELGKGSMDRDEILHL